MRSKFLYIFFIFLANQPIADAQFKIQNKSLIKPDINIVYIGVDNFLKITEIKNSDNLRLVVNDVESKFGQDGIYILRPSHQLSQFKIELLLGTKVVAEKTYYSKLILNPKVGLGKESLADTTLSIQEIINNSQLQIQIPGCLFHFFMRIHEFECIIYSDNKILSSTNIKGKGLSNIELSSIKNLKSGDKVAFQNIKTSGPTDARLFRNFFVIIVK